MNSLWASVVPSKIFQVAETKVQIVHCLSRFGLKPASLLLFEFLGFLIVRGDLVVLGSIVGRLFVAPGFLFRFRVKGIETRPLFLFLRNKSTELRAFKF